MIFGRSENLLGPYLDKKNIPLNHGGGTILLTGNREWYGVGHNAVCEFGGDYYLIFHGYDAGDNGNSKLRIEKLRWETGWPVIIKN
jgi:arabinan endo-1,5-alpha-L-arabinosidase